VEDGHPNVAYWLAQMERVGMTITLPQTTTLLDVNMRHAIYGYPPHMDPRPAAVARRAAFRRLAGIDQEAADG
jgi:hypothetical protein